MNKNEITFALTCNCGEKINGLFTEEDQKEILHCKCGFVWEISRPYKEK